LAVLSEIYGFDEIIGRKILGEQKAKQEPILNPVKIEQDEQ